jgi:hypothetical protein
MVPAGATTLCAWVVAIKRSARATHHMLRNHLVQFWVHLVWELAVDGYLQVGSSDHTLCNIQSRAYTAQAHSTE